MRLKAGDFIVALVILAAAGALFAGFSQPGGEPVAVISVDGEHFRTIKLSGVSGYTVAVPGDMGVTLAVERGRIRFVHSNCPDQTCVRSGWLSRGGEVAACLPGRVLVRLDGAGADVVIG